MKAADLALISAKKLSNSSVVAYHANMSDRFRKKAWEIQGIRDAIASDQIEPYYQPLVNGQTGALEGLETLVRWNHPELGTLSPGFFSHALDDPEIALPLTMKMLDLLLVDLKRWWNDGLRAPAGLNVGEYDLRDPDLVRQICEKMDAHDLPASALVVEITERAVTAANVETVIPILDEMRNCDLAVALDDFGTGTSSLTLLRSLPRTTIKIDKSFIDNIVEKPEDRAIVRALVQLAHDMKIKVVAEGVETEEQAAILRDYNVDFFQGYLFGKPKPAGYIDLTFANQDPGAIVVPKAVENRPRSRLG